MFCIQFPLDLTSEVKRLLKRGSYFEYFRLNSLRRLLNGCQRVSGLDYSIGPGSSTVSGERPKIKLDLYFDKTSRDFGLLMDLLAEASGLVQSLRSIH